MVLKWSIYKMWRVIFLFENSFPVLKKHLEYRESRQRLSAEVAVILRQQRTSMKNNTDVGK